MCLARSIARDVEYSYDFRGFEVRNLLMGRSLLTLIMLTIVFDLSPPLRLSLSDVFTVPTPRILNIFIPIGSKSEVFQNLCDIQRMFGAPKPGWHRRLLCAPAPNMTFTQIQF